jgi:hypothetical protein
MPSDASRRALPVDIKGFTDAVFIAEGLDPANADRQLYRRVSAARR